MANRQTMGAEEARKLFPRVVERASQGKTTLITKHGRPCAAVVPVAEAHARRRAGETFLDLRGSAKGIYGDAAKYIVALRKEWE